MMKQEYYPDTLYCYHDYESIVRRRKAEKEAKKRSRKDKNGKNRQK